MNSRAINPVKMSFVNFVKCFTNTDPWNAATTSDTTINQIPTHTRHAKKSMPLPVERKNITFLHILGGIFQNNMCCQNNHFPRVKT